jgi:aminoglycoside phosphotransferase (APT) family kinase protein
MSEAEITAAVAASAALVDADRLSAWAGVHLPGTGPIEVERHAAGHSNLTFVVRRSPAHGETGPEWILRRPPQGPLLPTAHDVLREYRVLSLLGEGSDVRVPRVVAACDDFAVIGAPFYLMERVDGVVIRDTLPDWLADDERDAIARHELGIDLVDALAELHTAPYQPLVDAGIGKADGYLERQLRRWRGQREGVQEAAKSLGHAARELPDYDVLRDWLAETIPDPVPAAVVHGDYKLDNVIVSAPPNTPRIAAIVDWEMATVGDPRADLGYLLSFWIQSSDELPWHDYVTDAVGFPSRDELIDRWAEKTGRDPGDPQWFTALAIWKLAILLEASFHRHLAGTTDDPFFALLEQGVPALLARAREVAGV